MVKKKVPEKNTIFSQHSLRKLSLLESEDWLSSQIDNHNEGSFLAAFKAYEDAKNCVSESGKVATIFGSSDYFVLGNGEIVINEQHHELQKAKELGFRVI